MKKFTLEAWIILRLLRLIVQTVHHGKSASSMLYRRDVNKSMRYLIDTYGHNTLWDNTAKLHQEENQ